MGKRSAKKRNPLNIIDDQFRSPTLAEDLAQACRLAVEKRAKGVYNASGKDIMSIFEMVERMADFYDCDKSIINRISTERLNQKAKRPPKTGFILQKSIKELAYQPHSFEEGLAIVEQQILEQEKPQLNNQHNETIIYSFISHVICKNTLCRNSKRSNQSFF